MILRADALTVQLAGRVVLETVDLEIQAGELLALVGPNGSGKSTLLRALCNLVPFHTGTIYPRHAHARERARFMAYLPQHNEDLPFTVREIVTMGRAPWQNAFGTATAEDGALTAEAMQLTGIDPLADQPFARLSGGEQQRVLLARTLNQNTKLFLLDEPTSALDYGQQIRVMEALARWRETHHAGMIVVLHDLNLASMFADRVLLLKNGRVVGQGPPVTLFTAERLESVYTCNILVDKHPCMPTPRLTLSGCARRNA